MLTFRPDIFWGIGFDFSVVFFNAINLQIKSNVPDTYIRKKKQITFYKSGNSYIWLCHIYISRYMDICNAFSLFSFLSILPVDTLSLVFQEPSIFSLHFGSRVPASSQRHPTQPALPTKAAQRKLRRCCKRRIRASKICDVKAVKWVVSVICCRERPTKITYGKKNNVLASWGVGIRLQKVSMKGHPQSSKPPIRS